VHAADDDTDDEDDRDPNAGDDREAASVIEDGYGGSMSASGDADTARPRPS
jgi:hypothetical protein